MLTFGSSRSGISREWAGVSDRGVSLLTEELREQLTCKDAPPSQSVAQLSCLYPAFISLLFSGSIFSLFMGCFQNEPKPMLSGKFFPEITCQLIMWSSKTFIILLASHELCVKAQKSSEDFCVP